MTRDDMGHVMFIGIGDFDLIVLAAVFDAVGEGVRLIAGAVLFDVLIYCRMSGDNVGWLGVTFDKSLHHASSGANCSAVRWLNTFDSSIQTRSIFESIS